MSEQIKKSDVSEKDIYGYVIESAKIAEKQIADLNLELKKSAEISKGILSKTKFTDSQSIKEAEKQIKLANVAMQKANELDRISGLTKKQMQDAEQALQKQREKGVAQMKKQSDAYNKLVVETRELKNESKRLGAELLALEQAGKKNTVEWSKTEKQYKETTAQANKLDVQLKKLDSSVGDNQRNVGNYKSIFSGLKNGLAQLGLAFGAFEGIKFIANTEVRLQSLQLALKNVLGTTDQYNKSFKFLTDLSKDYGQDLLVLTDTYKSFIASSNSSGLAIEERNKIYQSIIKSGSSLALSNEQIEGSLLAVSQMFSKGKVSAEELRGQLGERLPGAFGIMAKSMNVTEQQLDKMLSNGEVLAKDVLPKFGEELEKTFGANAKKNLETIGGAWNVLRTNISLYVNEANEGGRVTKGIAGTIAFLANNIGTIITFLGKLIQGFITYKAVMTAVNLKDQFTNWKNLRSAIKDTSVATDEASKNAKGFGNVLKGIGLTVAIDLLWEAGKAIWNFASGTMQAEFNLKKLNEGIDEGTKSAGQYLTKLDSLISKRRYDLDLLLASGKISRERYNQELKQIITLANTEILKAYELMKVKRANSAERLKELRAELEENGKYNDRGIQLIKLIGEETKQYSGYNTVMKELITKKQELNVEQQNVTVSLAGETKQRKESVKELEKEKKAYADVTDEIIRRFNFEQQIEDATKEFAITDTQKQLEDQLKLTTEYGTINNKRVDELLKEEEALRRKQIEEMNITQEERNFKLIELEDEMADKRRQIYADLETAQEDYAVKIQKKEEEVLKDRFKTTKEFVDLSFDYFIKRSEEKISQLDKEIQASEKQQSMLEELAKNGNITAQQSLAENERITKEANERKLKEQKRIERLKLAQTAFDVYGKKVEAGDKNPLISTIKDIELLRAFISSLPAFESGTENTGTNGQGIDGKGGFLSVLHPNERVLTAEQNAKVGDLSNVELSKIASDYNSGKIINLNHVGAVAGNSYDLLPLLSELKDLKHTVQNMPSNNIELGEITQHTMQIVQTSKRGNITNRRTYFIKK